MESVLITGLWKRTDKNDKTFLSGSLTPTSGIMIFTNSSKQKDADPDYLMYITQRKTEKKQSGDF